MAGVGRSSTERSYQEILRLIGEDFDNWVLENPGPSPRMPPHGCVALQIGILPLWAPEKVAIAEAFNRWSLGLAMRQLQPGQKLWVATCYPRPIVSSGQSSLEDDVARSPCGEYVLASP